MLWAADTPLQWHQDPGTVRVLVIAVLILAVMAMLLASHKSWRADGSVGNAKVAVQVGIGEHELTVHQRLDLMTNDIRGAVRSITDHATESRKSIGQLRDDLADGLSSIRTDMTDAIEEVDRRLSARLDVLENPTPPTTEEPT